MTKHLKRATLSSRPLCYDQENKKTHYEISSIARTCPLKILSNIVSG
jgi:hypothetical protein